MIILTGAAGFIGSVVLWRLNQEGYRDILLVDNLGSSAKWKNLVGREFRDYLHKDEFLARIQRGEFAKGVEAVIHIGACSSTSEPDAEYLMRNNFLYSQTLAEFALRANARLIYASSAQVYGDGSLGYDDADAITPTLRPVSMYGFSKQLMDRWVLRSGAVARCAGLRFFNVFGPQEYHKGEMRSVVVKAFEQIVSTGSVSLFKSYRPEFADGEQKRDFVYVKDCADVVVWLLTHPQVNGIFNVGTGQARSWKELATSVYAAMGRAVSVNYVEMPEKLRGQYQYFTEALPGKLRAAGYQQPWTTLESGITEYVQKHLTTNQLYLS